MKNNKTIDEIILNHSTRGMDKLQERYRVEHCKKAVEKFVTLQKGVVFLYTGFYVKGYAETDGPLGTYFLALALRKSGYKPVIITDLYCKDFFKDIETIYIPFAGFETKEYSKILKNYNPVCHFSIERLGRDKNGKYHNSRGVDIGAYTAPVDELYMLGSKNTPSFAIGDGGNEIGMGNFKEFLKNTLHVEPCIVESNYPIIASVSNWGAYGFIAYIQLFAKSQLLPTFDEIEEYMNYILKLGCVDGITCKCEKSVDGKEWYIEKEILEELKNTTLA